MSEYLTTGAAAEIAYRQARVREDFRRAGSGHPSTGRRHARGWSQWSLRLFHLR